VGPAVTESQDAISKARVRRAAARAVRYATVSLRPLPDFVILGTQRGGTTSLYRWLASHPNVAPASEKEVHYFDVQYHRGERWYRTHFPTRSPGQITGESTPYLLFHPLAPQRVARDLPDTTKFVVLLRDPTQRAISQYWHVRRQGDREPESLERAMELEPQRLATETDQFVRGEPSPEYLLHSYMARGEYAPQLHRWFDAVGRERILVLESERLFADPAASQEVLDWLGLPPHTRRYPVTNGAPRLEEASAELADRLDAHFAPHNEELFALLGRKLWSGVDGIASPGATPAR
jgi:hypothetical protein